MYIFSKQEELVMLSVFRLKEEACLMTIRKHIKDHAQKDWAFGSLYIALERLRKKEFIQSVLSDPMPQKGGKAVKYYQLTKQGLEALEQLRKIHDVMWKEFLDYSPEAR
jgi:DNA-binding PadR family transcriptional regulator